MKNEVLTLTESKLTPAELRKVNSKTKELRIDILRRLIKKGGTNL